MASYRLYSKTRTWFGDRGQLLAGGYLKFYEAGSLTRKDVYGDRGLTTNNGDTVALDSSGRLEHDCWADVAEAFFVEVYDADDVKQGEEDNVELPGGTGQVIPIPEEGEFLTGDGTQLLVAEIRQVPDPTGHANEQLGTDGTVIYWEAKPEAPELPVTVADGKAIFGVAGGDFTQILYGSDSVAGSSLKTASKSVTFASAFKTGTTPRVVVELTGGAPTGSGTMPKHTISSVSATGFTVNFTTLTGGTSADNYSGADMTGTVNFVYHAVGLVDEPA